MIDAGYSPAATGEPTLVSAPLLALMEYAVSYWEGGNEPNLFAWHKEPLSPGW